MIIQHQEADRYRKIRGFEYGKEYSMDEVADKLGFTNGTAKVLFYSNLIKHGIITPELKPSYLSFMAGLIQWPKAGKEENTVTYSGTIIIGDLLEAYEALPPKS
ncbi:hypothetical protein [Salinimicrobium sp. GXAS 041]|uniref:hypothetical protein n=1 Tax=Salinimicrobium sp. GXAS 041 TaxID=3400806 RepID=UPI003C74E009